MDVFGLPKHFITKLSEVYLNFLSVNLGLPVKLGTPRVDTAFCLGFLEHQGVSSIIAPHQVG
jgi:hypothetical protein